MAATERAGVRLITVDRPGYGMASPRPGRTLLDWASDYATARTAARYEWFAEGWVTVFDPGAGTADDALLAEDGVLEPALAWIEEAARQGGTGWAEDCFADALPWGFSPSQVTHDVHVWWGDDDQLVRRESAEHLARAIERSTLTVLAGQGHLFPIRHWEDILAKLQPHAVLSSRS